MKPKLYYFDIRARGQYVMALLHYLKYDFDLILFTVKDGIPNQVRQQCTFGQVPLYIDDDITLCQSQAITRYISTKNNFYGNNPNEIARVNEIVESIEDMLGPIFTAQFRMNVQYKDEFKKNNKINQILQVYENKLNNNKFIAGGNDYTYADLCVYITFDYVNHLGYVNDVYNYPKLIELKNYFESLPHMNNYLKYINNIPKEKESKY